MAVRILMHRASHVRYYPILHSKTFTYETRVHLDLVCKLLRRKRLPVIFYEGPQHSRVDSKKGRSVFRRLSARHLALVKMGRQCMMSYLLSLPRHIACWSFRCDLKTLNCPNEFIFLDKPVASLKLSYFGNLFG